MKNELLLFVTGPLPGPVLAATYDGWLVALSYVVATLASYTAIDLANRVREFRAEPRKAAAWLVGGAVAMGAGIWSMHFVAMLAYQLPVQVRYDLWTTAVSMAAAIATSGFALFIVTQYSLSVPRLVLGGGVMGAAIGAMHYIGMASMRLDALVMYYAGPFALSVANAIICSTAALWLVARRAQADMRSRILAAAVMGMAVAGMHYTGMYATVCVSVPAGSAVVAGLDPAILAVVITAITLLIMGMALTVSMQSQLLSRTLRDQNQLLQSEIERKRQAEAELQLHRDNLQALIDERTRELTKANANINESERRFRATFDQAAVGIAHTSCDGRYLQVNRKFCEMLGYEASELIGRESANYSIVEGNGKSRDLRTLMLDGGLEVVSGIKRYIRKNGTVLIAKRTVSLARDDSGNPLYFIRVIEDITDQMQAEEAIVKERALLRTIIDTIPDYIYVKDSEGRFQIANKAWLKERGFDSEGIAGKTAFDLFPRGIAEKVAAQDTNVAQTGVPLLNCEQQIGLLTPEGNKGELRWCSTTKVPMRDASGKIVGTIGIVREITQQKLMTQRREMEYTTTQVLAEAGSVEEAMPIVLRTICEALGWTCGAHWKWHETEELLRCAATWHADIKGVEEFLSATRERPNEAPAWRGTAPGTSTGGVVRRVWYSGSPAWFHDVMRQPDFRRGPAAAAAGLHSAFGFPILAGSQPLGVMEFYSCEIKEPDAALLQMVRAIGNQIGQFTQRKQAEAALQRAHTELETKVRDRTLDLEQVNDTLRGEIEQKRRVEAELQLHRDHLQSLIDDRTAALAQSNRVLEQRTVEVLRVTKMSNLLQTAGDMREASEILSRMMSPLAAPHAGAIYLTAASLNRLDCLTSWGDANYVTTIAPDECWGLRRGGVYGAANSDQDVYCAHVHADAQHAPYLCVPMMAHGVSLGLLHVGFVQEAGCADVPDHERARVQRLADQITLALANVKLRQSLREQSIRDLLTGLYNRRYLEESLEREVARAWRDKTPLAVLMLDVDYFKRFNDQYGHQGGDAVLQALGRVLRESARASDLVARYGGEEFTVLLHNTGHAGAREWGERLRESVRNMEVVSAGQTLPPITISLGLAIYHEHGSKAEDLLRAADAALYDAKRSGRDRLMLAAPVARSDEPALCDALATLPAVALEAAA